jgi:hypothetical protein
MKVIFGEDELTHKLPNRLELVTVTFPKTLQFIDSITLGMPRGNVPEKT